MNNYKLLPGVYPTMITPYNKDGSVDIGAVEAITEWYIEQKCVGVFANCLSSELDHLSLEERIAILKAVKKVAGCKMKIVASGMKNEDIDNQIKSLKSMEEYGAEVLVLIASRMVAPNESEEILKQKTEKIMNAIPNADFGFYECPVPYSKEISPDMLNWCSQNEKFVFFKDTTCQIDKIKAKLEAINRSNLCFFNANSTTLYESMEYGAMGLSGVMANVHPKWYAEMIDAFIKGDKHRAKKIQNFVGGLSIFQYQKYPLNAKYYMKLAGIPIYSEQSRNYPGVMLNESQKKEIEQFFEMSKYIDELI